MTAVGLHLKQCGVRYTIRLWSAYYYCCQAPFEPIGLINFSRPSFRAHISSAVVDSAGPGFLARAAGSLVVVACV